ncbi:MAG: hypothetical protein R3B47_11090 [Bacteroidia bacterium]
MENTNYFISRFSRLTGLGILIRCGIRLMRWLTVFLPFIFSPNNDYFVREEM